MCAQVRQNLMIKPVHKPSVHVTGSAASYNTVMVATGRIYMSLEQATKELEGNTRLCFRYFRLSNNMCSKLM